MTRKVDERNLEIAAQLVEMKTSELLEAIQQYSKEDTIISGVDLRRHLGWSMATYKRRLQQFGISQVTLPGWKMRKGVKLGEFIEKSGLKINLAV